MDQQLQRHEHEKQVTKMQLDAEQELDSAEAAERAVAELEAEAVKLHLAQDQYLERRLNPLLGNAEETVWGLTLNQARDTDDT